MKRCGVIFILLSAIFFSLGGVLIKINTFSAVSISGARCLFAFVVMLIYMKAVGHKFIFNSIVLLGAIINAGMSLTFTMANKMTTAANAIVLQFIMPVFLILLLWIFWKQKPDGLAVATVLVSIVGLICFFIESLSTGGMAGNLLAIFSGFLYALVFLIKKIPNADFESSILLSHLINFVIGIPFLVQESDFSAVNILSIVALGVVQMGLAFVCLNVGLNYVQPVAASLISMIEPILNPILVALIYGEKMGFMAIVGSVIVLGSATVYNIIQIQQTKRA